MAKRSPADSTKPAAARAPSARTPSDGRSESADGAPRTEPDPTETCATGSFFDRIIGHESEKRSLEARIANDNMPHALLFTGPQGIGKRLIARACAGALVCRGASPDIITQQRHLFATGNHPDARTVAKEEERRDLSAEQVRTICSELSLSPYYGSSAVRIIDNAHEMSISAANALLMTLEEPPAGRFLFLITHTPHRLLPTIISRCQVVELSALSAGDSLALVARLIRQCNGSPELQERLIGMTDGSVEPLRLGPFLDPQTFTIADKKGALEHLTQLSEQIATIARRLSRLVGSQAPGSPAIPISIATDFGAAKDELHLLWQTLVPALRRRMRAAKSAHTSSLWGEALRDSLEVERLVRERSLNAQLALSCLFERITRISQEGE